MDAYILRHGETHWNAINRIQGQQPAELNDRGRAQARAVARELSNLGIEKIYSSDLIRSLETAEIVNKELNVELLLSDKLREIGYGKWEGQLWETVYAENPDLGNSWECLGADFSSPGGEKALGFRKRVIDEFSRIIMSEPDRKILLVVHGQVMKMILSCFQQVKASELFTFIRLSNCQYIHFDSAQLDSFCRTVRAGQSFNLLSDQR